MERDRGFILFSMVGVFLLAGCSRPVQVVVLRLDEGVHIGRAMVSQGTTTIDLSRLNMAVATSLQPGRSGDETTVTMLKDDDIVDIFAGAVAAQPVVPRTWTLYFEPGRGEMLPTSAGALAEAIKAGQLSLFADISVVEHTMPDDILKANGLLPLQRARKILDALTQAGIPPDGLEISAIDIDLPAVQQAANTPLDIDPVVEITIR